MQIATAKNKIPQIQNPRSKFTKFLPQIQTLRRNPLKIESKLNNRVAGAYLRAAVLLWPPKNWRVAT